MDNGDALDIAGKYADLVRSKYDFSRIIVFAKLMIFNAKRRLPNHKTPRRRSLQRKRQ
jgi:hypothetical protein